MDVSICMCSLRLIAIGNIPDTTMGDSIIMLDLNDIIVATGGRMIDIEAISQEKVVEEEVVVVDIVEGADNR